MPTASLLVNLGALLLGRGSLMAGRRVVLPSGMVLMQRGQVSNGVEASLPDALEERTLFTPGGFGAAQARQGGWFGWRPSAKSRLSSLTCALREVELPTPGGSASRMYTCNELPVVEYVPRQELRTSADQVPEKASASSIKTLYLTQLLGSLGGSGGATLAPPTAAAPVCTIDSSLMVREVAAELLPNVSADAPLMEAGLDSLGVVEFGNRLSSRLGEGVELPETLLFDHPTVRQVGTHLQTRLQPQLTQTAPSPAAAGLGGGSAMLQIGRAHV